MSLAVGLLLAAVLLSSPSTATNRPNIIVILTDDLGWNDVSFHGSNQIPTPNIDALAYNGIILNSHYVPALCTPSRASLLTGKYPTHLGMQHLVILAPEPWGLPLHERLMPEYLRDAGYRTHAIGKWHLGFFKKEYTPAYRGFDNHYGYWNGYQDYYDHSMKATFAPYTGYDMRRNMSVDWSAAGRYSTDLFTEEAVSVIRGHDAKRGPLFLYLAHLAPHAGNANEPFQAPDEEIAKFGHIEDPERRVYAAMVSKVDESVGEVMSALRAKGMLDNSIVVFLSDNGAPTHGIHSNRGSNWPLRGMKNTPMEGGLRGVAAIWSPLLNNTQRVSNQLMHVSDWLPTFYSAAVVDHYNSGQQHYNRRRHEAKSPCRTPHPAQCDRAQHDGAPRGTRAERVDAQTRHDGALQGNRAERVDAETKHDGAPRGNRAWRDGRRGSRGRPLPLPFEID